MNDEKFFIIDVNLTRGLAFVLVVGLLALTLIGYLAFGHNNAAASNSMVRNASYEVIRRYYLTVDPYPPTSAKSVCEAGFHFASLWEIMDTSNLMYDYSLGLTELDSGEGPPTHWKGWIRTGYTNSSTNTPGIGNCLGWKESGSDQYGTYIFLNEYWSDGGDFGNWKVSASTCNLSNRVWCVEN